MECNILNASRLGLIKIILAGIATIHGHLFRRAAILVDMVFQHQE